MVFACPACSYFTHEISNFNKHIQTKRHRSRISKHGENALKFENECKYCKKIFVNKYSLQRHIKFNCKENDDESLQEYAKLLNSLKNKDNELQRVNKQMELLTKNLQLSAMHHSSNVNNGVFIAGNLNNNITLNLLNYNETDYSHLSDTDYIKCIRDCNHCVKTLIEKVHFNKDKPENMNIYISSIKGNFVMVYRDNKWQVRNRKAQIDDLFDYNELMLENWYRDYHEKYPHIITSFQRYLKNKETDDDVTSNVKEEILMLLYNERDKAIEKVNTGVR